MQAYSRTAFLATGVALAAGAIANARTVTQLGANVTVTVNGTTLVLERAPIERAGRVFVPLRGVFERLGADVVFASGRINATAGSRTVALTVGSTMALVNGQPSVLDDAPFITAGRTFVPLRFVSTALGAKVAYSGATRTIAIITPPAAGVPRRTL